MGRGRDRLEELHEELSANVDPEKMLRLIFNFINFKPANIDIYFLLNNNEKPLTVKDLCNKLSYSERTIRTYLGILTDRNYVKKIPTIRDRPCFAYKALSPKQVWEQMVEEMRMIKRKASMSFGTV